MQLTYENKARQIALVETLERFLEDGEFVIRRAPFRWMRRKFPGESADFTRPPDGWAVISGAYEGQSAASVCDGKWELVHDYEHLAVVRRATPGETE